MSPAAKAIHDALNQFAVLGGRLTEVQCELAAKAVVNTPELHDFTKGAVLEALHQRERWGSQHDAGKQPEDWFWLIGYLAGKALHAAKVGDRDKALHHCISSAAALANWHAALLGANHDMRPGIEPPLFIGVDSGAGDFHVGPTDG